MKQYTGAPKPGAYAPRGLYFCVLRLRARRSERCDGPQPYRVTEGPDPRPTHSGGSQPHPLLVKELEFSGRGKGNARH